MFKDIIKELKKKIIDGQKTLAIQTSENVYPESTKTSYNSIIRKQMIQFLKEVKDVIRYFPKQDLSMANKHTKKGDPCHQLLKKCNEIHYTGLEGLELK